MSLETTLHLQSMWYQMHLLHDMMYASKKNSLVVTRKNPCAQCDEKKNSRFHALKNYHDVIPLSTRLVTTKKKI